MTQPPIELAPFLEKLDLGTAKIRERIVHRARHEPRVGAFLQRGLSIFGDANRFSSWLRRPHPVLGYKLPLLILLDEELEPLEDELTRIEHGELNAWERRRFQCRHVIECIRCRKKFILELS